MNDLTYKIEFYDYWSTASGLSGGALADSLCLKDKNGLPYVPGKTIKGLFREAAKTLMDLNHSDITKTFIFDVFGEPERAADEENGEEKLKSAISFFSNAVFNVETSQAITRELAPHLFEQITTTALEPTGLAKNHSLRRSEYSLPCTLYGEILDAAYYKDALSTCAAFIKRLGLNRHRGYGRCKISIL